MHDDFYTFQPRNGSIGIDNLQELEQELEVSTPQRFDWNTIRRWERSCNFVSTPQRFDWNDRLEITGDFWRVSTPQRFDWNYIGHEKAMETLFQPRNGSIGIYTMSVNSRFLPGFNPATVRLESPTSASTSSPERVSTPQRFDWNVPVLSEKRRRHLCFNPATVRLEFALAKDAKHTRRFQPRNGSIGITMKLTFEPTGEFQPRNGSIGISHTGADIPEPFLVSTPQRFDWNQLSHVERNAVRSFNPATVRLE